MPQPWLCGILFVSFAMLGVTAHPLRSEDAKGRFALIVANAAYSNALGPLDNPRKDAALISDALLAVGFPRDNIKIVSDVGRGALMAAVEDHADRLRAAGGGAIGFFYYSGHGAAKPNTDRNYLIPITAMDFSSGGFWHDAVELNAVHRALQEGAPEAAHIVVFDACRNELRTGQRGGGGFARSGDWGGMLVAYSTGPGATASDGSPDAPGSPYAVALAEQLQTAQSISAPELFANVRAIVRKRVSGQQPWYLNGLDAKIVFSASAAAATKAGVKAEPPPTPPTDATRQTPPTGAMQPAPLKTPLFQGLLTVETDLRAEPRQSARAKMRLGVGSTLLVLTEVENTFWYRVRVIDSDIEGFVMKNQIRRLQ